MSGGNSRPGPFARAAGAAAGAGVAAAAARASYAALRRRPPGGEALWARTNHRGEPVTLLEGPAVAVGAALASALTPGLSPRGRAALVAAAVGAAAFGGYDDLAGSGDRRGFRGHMGALASGDVTTGAVKIGGIGATGLVAAAAAGGHPADVIVNAGLIAGGANLLNLFDLRPGRAIKVAVAGSTLLAGAGARASAVAGPAGAALALLPEDLGERAMLGDAGSNALGAMLGASAAGLSRPARVALLAAIVGLTAASEVVSFTAVIERTPALRWLDMLGRRAAEPPGPPTTATDGGGAAAATRGVQNAGPVAGAVSP
jgi:UDP-GlcNAc:undecaprenyl-phosphate/decaprenyl-phosphate GlcNAc-1-phosphate transferase